MALKPLELIFWVVCYDCLNFLTMKIKIVKAGNMVYADGSWTADQSKLFETRFAEQRFLTIRERIYSVLTILS